MLTTTPAGVGPCTGWSEDDVVVYPLWAGAHGGGAHLRRAGRRLDIWLAAFFPRRGAHASARLVCEGILAGRPRREHAVGELEVLAVVLGQDHVHRFSSDAPGLRELVDEREGEAPLLILGSSQADGPARPNVRSSAAKHCSVTAMWSVPVSMISEKCRMTAAANCFFSSTVALKFVSN